VTNRTYTDLFSLIRSLCGVSNFTSNEETSILNFVNRRIRQAYGSSQVWPRYIVGAQARPAVNGVIARTFTPSSKSITSASRSGTTVTAVCSTAVDFVDGMYVTVAGLSGTVTPNGTFQVTGVDTTTVANDTFTYELTTGTGSETYTGSGTVIAVAIPDIESFNRIWANNPLNIVSANEYEFYVDFDGAHVINNYSNLDGFWVGFIKASGVPFTANSTDIPDEYFQYVAHATYADFLRMDGQIEKAMSEEQVAQQYLMIELEKAETQRNNNSLYRRISTYISRQSR
jgi:hypothetical protein